MFYRYLSFIWSQTDRNLGIYIRIYHVLFQYSFLDAFQIVISFFKKKPSFLSLDNTVNAYHCCFFYSLVFWGHFLLYRYRISLFSRWKQRGMYAMCMWVVQLLLVLSNMDSVFIYIPEYYLEALVNKHFSLLDLTAVLIHSVAECKTSSLVIYFNTYGFGFSCFLRVKHN